MNMQPTDADARWITAAFRQVRWIKVAMLQIGCIQEEVFCLGCVESLLCRADGVVVPKRWVLFAIVTIVVDGH